MVTVIGNIVSKNGITLFLADGTSQVLPADSFKTQSILQTVLPALASGQHPQIDLDEFSIAKVIAQATGGAVKVTEDGGQLTIETKAGIVQNGEALRQHVEAAANGGGRALKNFMAKFIKVSAERKHAADELLAFMKGADLPIADDGSIIGYKFLAPSGDTFVDQHSKVVKQNVGSLVFMPASKVSDDRRQLCSTGLHIASTDYLRGGWSSNRLFLVKIQPNDVISVPIGERSKMRVCAYHIVKCLPEADSKAILGERKRIEDLPEAAKMLMDVVAGNHVPISQTVEITMDGKLKITDLEKRKFLQMRKPRATRPLTKKGAKPPKITVAQAKAIIDGSMPYEKKLAKAQKLYDDGMSIREIAPVLKMDRESLGRNLKRHAGR